MNDFRLFSRGWKWMPDEIEASRYVLRVPQRCRVKMLLSIERRGWRAASNLNRSAAEHQPVKGYPDKAGPQGRREAAWPFPARARCYHSSAFGALQGNISDEA